VAVVGILFSFGGLSCGFEAHSLDESIKVVYDAVIEAIELRSLLVMDSCIRVNRAEKAGRERCVNAFEKLQEDQTEGVRAREELIRAGIRKLGDEAFGSQLREVIAERGKRIAIGRASESLDDVRMDFGSGEAITGGNVCEAHKSMHEGELPGMIEPQS